MVVEKVQPLRFSIANKDAPAFNPDDYKVEEDLRDNLLLDETGVCTPPPHLIPHRTRNTSDTIHHDDAHLICYAVIMCDY